MCPSTGQGGGLGADIILLFRSFGKTHFIVLIVSGSCTPIWAYAAHMYKQAKAQCIERPVSGHYETCFIRQRLLLNSASFFLPRQTPMTAG